MRTKFLDNFSSEAALVNGELYITPTRSFLPENLFQASCEGKNLLLLGSQTDVVLGSSIGLDLNNTITGTLGEFCERYCASFQDPNTFIRSSYNTLLSEGENALHPDSIKLYADWQYKSSGFRYKKLQTDDYICWTIGYDIIQKKNIYIPAFLVYLPYHHSFDKNVSYLSNTSTGLAAGNNLANSLVSGFLECAERHAYSNFWYNQRYLDVPTYDKSLILETYGNNSNIRKLYDNDRVKIKVFDLSDLSPVETMVVYMFFKYKGLEMMTMGAASRFAKTDALIKAILEAYQGIEYAIMLKNKKKDDKTIVENSFDNIDDFHKHFEFYNRFPELRLKVPIFVEAMKDSGNSKSIKVSTDKMQSLKEVDKLDLQHLLVIDITTSDVRDLGFTVSRVITPGWAYITGIHTEPFLGSEIFRNKTDLFIEYPHSFP